MKVMQAYRFALDPTPAQVRALRSHAGAARFAWNWALGQCRERYAAERKWYSGAELHKLWNQAKKADPTLGWWDQNSKCAYQQAFRDLDRALRDFARSRRGERRGKRLGFPRFKKRGRCRDSFRLTGTLRCDRSVVTLPRLGTIRTHVAEMKLFNQRYLAARERAADKALDPLSRLDWDAALDSGTGTGTDWARPPAGHQPSPSWLGQNVPPITRLTDIDVGTRHPVAASRRR